MGNEKYVQILVLKSEGKRVLGRQRCRRKDNDTKVMEHKTVRWIHLSQNRKFLESITAFRSRDSVVSIATAYGLEDRGVGVRVLIRSRIFIFSRSSTPALGPTQPPIQQVPGVLYPGIKRQGREADPSPPASAEVNKTWIYTFTPPYVFMA
jgi:hypothetical protein